MNIFENLQKNLQAQDTIKDILLTIKTRGPNAFKNLILSLRQSDHENIANILEGRNNTNSNMKYVKICSSFPFFLC